MLTWWLDPWQFQHHQIECEFEGQKKSYDTWCCPLWDWILDHLINPEVVRHFEWDAQKVFKYDGENFTQIYTEPWTGKRFWDVQVRFFELFHFKIIMLTGFIDIITRWCKDGLPWTLCRQDSSFIIWDRKGLSCHGKDCQPPSKNQEWWWDWWCQGCWVASSGMSKIVFLLDLDLILIVGPGQRCCRRQGPIWLGQFQTCDLAHLFLQATWINWSPLSEWMLGRMWWPSTAAHLSASTNSCCRLWRTVSNYDIFYCWANK